MKLNEFVCLKCGECCRHIDKVEGLKHLQTNGICCYLKDNLCTIYDNRPDLCNRERVFEMYKDQYSEEEFTQLFIKFCKYFQEIKEKNES